MVGCAGLELRLSPYGEVCFNSCAAFSRVPLPRCTKENCSNCLAHVVTRAESADATLSPLSLCGVTQLPVFASGIAAYTASVANGVAETTVAATASDANVSVEVTPEDADDQTLGDQVNLAVGETAISVEVTAEDGETTQTYTVTVTVTRRWAKTHAKRANAPG